MKLTVVLTLVVITALGISGIAAVAISHTESVDDSLLQDELEQTHHDVPEWSPYFPPYEPERIPIVPCEPVYESGDSIADKHCESPLDPLPNREIFY